MYPLKIFADVRLLLTINFGLSFRMPYDGYFGGATALTPEQFEKMHGFPNVYFGWGGEDDDSLVRTRLAGFKIRRYDKESGRYTMISHKRDEGNPVSSNRYVAVSQSCMENGMFTMKHISIDLENCFYLYCAS